MRVGFAVVDVETTGLNAHYDAIVEIAVVTADIHGELISAWHSLVDPGQWIPPEAAMVHEIEDWDVEGAPKLADLAPQVLRRLDGRVLVCHNTEFDCGFLDAALPRPDEQSWGRWSICTMTAAQRFRMRKLETVATALGVPRPPSPAHSALSDALRTWGALHRMVRLGWLDDVDELLLGAARSPLPESSGPFSNVAAWPRFQGGDDGKVPFNEVFHFGRLPPLPASAHILGRRRTGNPSAARQAVTGGAPVV